MNTTRSLCSAHPSQPSIGMWLARLTPTLTLVLAIAAPLSAHSYERGALAPKDAPLMPTVIVYSGGETASAPITETTVTATAPAAPAPIDSSNHAAPPPVAPTPAPAPSAPQSTSVQNTAPVTSPAQTSTPAPAASAVATPSSRQQARHHMIQILLLIILIASVAYLIWWFNRPYIPPHARRHADPSQHDDIDLDLD